MAGRLKNRAGGKAAYFNRFSLFQTAFRTIRPSEKLGRVDIQLLKRILRQKTADARRKCEPMPPIGECLQRGRCRFMMEKPPKY
ncbi:molybdopterin biosynthesis protein MoeA [Neisseria bacilliformis ATCC BAA-1200]|uniref:Molybdopterin biosynthesis protein MoeA n=1 Tax=Neisseria bacilliformis ATCC BAA-1200 TaxID=888742 RepID=F2BEP7_9NEIS|nr:molybdopterin biosynthesis protein MoeA [Neisseria bacilliformis ATCC BAA-1200]